MNRSRKDTDYKRRVATREIQDRLLIVCEGEGEEIYFGLLRQEYRLQALVLVKCSSGGFQKVVDKAEEEVLKANEAGDPYTEGWCVFDTEDSIKESDFGKAVGSAKKEEFKLAISNPSVEYWFLLHFEKSTPQLQNAHKATEKLRTRISDYEKNQQVLKRILSKKVLPHTNKAIENARQCHTEMKKVSTDEYPNPCTTVYLLIEKLLELARNKPY